MRILWIAGLGAVLITGGVSAQGITSTPGSAIDRQEGALSRTTDAPLRQQQPDSPDQTLRAQDPRLSQGRMQTQQNMGQPTPIPPALQGSTAQQSPDRTLNAQDPRLNQGRLPARQNVQSSGDDARRGAAAERRAGANERRAGSSERRDAPRNPADRAYMGGGMILENGRPVLLPGDPPGMGSDFQGGRVGQSGEGDQAAQTNVGQTGTRD